MMRMGHIFGGLIALALTACTQAESKDTAETSTPETPTLEEIKPIPPIVIEERPEGTTFEDVLLEYQALNERLTRVAAPLRLKNSSLCSDTERDPGFIPHRLKDYPPALQDLAKTYLGLEDTGLFIRSVRRDSPADEADIQAGDKLIALNDFPIPDDGVAVDKFYAAIARQAFGEAQTRLKLRTPEGHIYETKLRADTACAVPVNVIFSETVNGHTDGEDVMITSALMKTVPDDVNLALIIAHEMSHIIARHKGELQGQNLELEADRMALVLMENAGYDIDAAIDYWQRAYHPHRSAQGQSRSHPSIDARLLNFTTERARIRRQQAQGLPLTFQ